MRGIGRRIRSNFGMGASRMSIRVQAAWYWRWLGHLLLMILVAAAVWWVMENSHRITGLSQEEARRELAVLADDSGKVRGQLEEARASLVERERQLQIEKAAQTELARTVVQLQEENAALKEDLGFLRRLMSSGATPEGVAVSDLKVEREEKANEFRYRMLLVQGGQRKQDFRGRVQIVARIARGTALSTQTYPEDDAGDAGTFEFRFYHRVEGRFAIPEDAVLRSVDVRILAVPGGQVKLSRTINMT
jgi:hypothetical protein